MKAKKSEVQFARWMGPLLEALRELGGSSKPRPCSQWIAEHSHVSADEQEARIESGGERFHNQVQWARQYLVWEGLIDGSKWGVWTLTDVGAKTTLNEEQSLQIYRKWVEFHKTGKTSDKASAKEFEEPEELPAEALQSDLLAVILNLSPTGFERLCKRILTEWGFEDIVLTGQSHDGGVDGTATLMMNPFVSFDVAFQCKRYKDSVGRKHISEFRGSKRARHADKLIFITTGYFSKEAIKEARGDGAVTVELVDGEMLVDLFKEKQLGLMRVEQFTIDNNFFNQFN